ncbi:MAG TPA: glycosyltransferase family 39 protein [Anaerolineae bacterium]|nr:glycosyltransferase family 39 protein [Anaerolineae bacterium]
MNHLSKIQPVSVLGRQSIVVGMLGVILLATFLRLLGLEAQSIAFDEGYSLAVGSADWPTLFQATLSSGVHPPLFYILYKLVLPLWGTTEYGARFIAAAFGILAVPLTYKLGHLLFNHRVAWLAAALLALNPVHVWLSQEARMYALLITLTLAGMLCFWQALHTRGRRYWLGLIVLQALVFNLHFFGLWLPLIQFGFILANFGRYHRQFRVWTAAQFSAGLTLLPWLVALSTREFQSFGIGFLDKPTLIDLPLTLWNLSMGLILNQIWPLSLVAFAIALLALSSGLYRTKHSFGRSQLLLSIWLFAPLLLVWIISQRRSFYADRYLSFLLPTLILLVAFGVLRLKQPAWQYLLLAGLIANSLYGLIAIKFEPIFQKDPWRDLASFIEQRERPGDVILLYSTHLRFPFDYYYRGHSPEKPISLNLERYPLESLVADHRRAWVIYPYTRRPTHYPMQPLLADGYWADDPDRNPLLVNWLDTYSSHVVDYRHFLGIQLWLVDLPERQEVTNRG